MAMTTAAASAAATTESLLWRITWTLAFPAAVKTFLHNDDSDDDDDGNVWHCLAFRCLWSDNNAQKTIQSNRNNSNHEILLSTNDKDHFCWSDSLGYGEITEGAVWKILRVIQQHEAQQQQRQQQPSTATNGTGGVTFRHVVDLGSGTGRVVLAAALAWSPPKQSGGTTGVVDTNTCPPVVVVVTGLEIVPKLHEQAISLQTRWNETIDSDETAVTVVLDFRCSDFTVDTDWIETAELVFMHCTVFSKALFTTMCELCARVKTGTWLVTVSHPLDMLDVFECVSDLEVEMSWGRGIAYLQQKL